MRVLHMVPSLGIGGTELGLTKVVEHTRAAMQDPVCAIRALGVTGVWLRAGGTSATALHAPARVDWRLASRITYVYRQVHPHVATHVQHRRLFFPGPQESLRREAEIKPTASPSRGSSTPVVEAEMRHDPLPRRRWMTRLRLPLCLATAILSLLSRVGAELPPCTGDCNGDRTVAVNELVRGVGIALGGAPVGDCPDLDESGDGRIRINELVTAVARALNGCSYGPLTVDRSSLCFKGSVGEEFPPMEVQVLLSRGGWEVEPQAPWLMVSPSSGEAPASVSIGLDTNRLVDGTHQAEIRFQDVGGGSVVVTVRASLESEGLSPGWRLQTLEPVGSDRGESTSLAITPDGRPAVAFFRSDATIKRALRLTTAGDCGWSAETVTHDGIDSSLAFDSSGQPHVSFFDDRLLALGYARRVDGTWRVTTVDQEGSGGSTGHRTSLALDAADRPHISYLLKFVAGQVFTYDLRFARFEGVSWLRETVDAEHQTGWDSSLALDSNGRPQITYHDNGTNQLKHAEWVNGGWSLQIIDRGGRPSSLRLDSSDTPHVAYHVPPQDGSLRYAVHRDGVWQHETIDFQGQSPSGGTRAFASLALDAAEQPHIAYVDFNTESLKYASRNDKGNWQIDIVDSGSGLGDFCSLQIDPDGVPHVSYIDFAHGTLKYAHGPANP